MNGPNLKICTFFGHNSFGVGVHEERLKEVVEKLILEEGVKSFLIGTHGKFDNLALKVCRFLRRKYKDIVITVVFTSYAPFRKNPVDNLADSEVYYHDVETMIYDIGDVYFKEIVTQSNRRMVEDSDVVVCFVDMNKEKSGAKLAVKYAMKMHKEIINIYEK